MTPEKFELLLYEILEKAFYKDLESWNGIGTDSDLGIISSGQINSSLEKAGWDPKLNSFSEALNTLLLRYKVRLRGRCVQGFHTVSINFEEVHLEAISEKVSKIGNSVENLKGILSRYGLELGKKVPCVPVPLEVLKELMYRAGML